MHKRSMLKYGGAAAALGVFLVAALLITENQPRYQTAVVRPPANATAPVVAPRDEYGIPEMNLDVFDRRVQRNETFAEILTRHNVPYEQVVALANSARPVFNVRTLRAGHPIRVYRDSLNTARYLVYEKDPIRYVVFNLAADSAGVYEGERDVRVQRRRLSGSIERSLYETLEEQELSSRLVPELAMSLSEVFAWQVDFFRIREGDDFSVIYEERTIDGEPIGIGRIVAARFGHRGSNFYGFYFDEGERPDYYDDEGNSLRKALLKAPLKFKRISSRYSKRRLHPVQKRYKSHLGTDYAADPGTPIYSVGDGVVVEARFKRYNGNYVKIRHNATYTTGYLHMSRIANGIRPGATVRQGEVIGYVGSTGLATGPHVCYRYWKNGVQIDPFSDTIPPAHPVDPSVRDAFTAVRDSLMPLLIEPALPRFADRLIPSGVDPLM